MYINTLKSEAKTTEALFIDAIKLSLQEKGKYITVYTEFGTAYMVINTALESRYCSTEQFKIYWLNGKERKYSDATLIMSQNLNTCNQ